VLIARGDGDPTLWAVYSTELGSPVGDWTGGTFRFVCTAAQATCTLSIRAWVISDTSTAAAPFHPRILIYRGGDPGNAQPELICEYGDGPFQTVAREPFPGDDPLVNRPDVKVDIGGTADCGGPPAAGEVTQIVVPTGDYDVFTTFGFAALGVNLQVTPPTQ